MIHREPVDSELWIKPMNATLLNLWLMGALFGGCGFSGSSLYSSFHHLTADAGVWQGDTRMKPAILAGLIFWGTMARVLSELMTWSVEHTQQGLLWLCNGMWAGAAGMVVCRLSLVPLRKRAGA
jgi:hypothetical protein